MFREIFRKDRGSLGSFEKFLMRFLDADPNSSTDFLSYIAFTKPYLKKIFELGFDDAQMQHQALLEFFDR